MNGTSAEGLAAPPVLVGRGVGVGGEDDDDGAVLSLSSDFVGIVHGFGKPLAASRRGGEHRLRLRHHDDDGPARRLGQVDVAEAFVKGVEVAAEILGELQCCGGFVVHPAQVGHPATAEPADTGGRREVDGHLGDSAGGVMEERAARSCGDECMEVEHRRISPAWGHRMRSKDA